MRPILRGSIDQSVEVRVLDTDGLPVTTAAFDTAGIALWYRRQGGAKVSITPADLAALTTAHADGGFKHISDGLCRLDLPDAATADAAGVNGVVWGGSATNMVMVGGTAPLVAFDPYDAGFFGVTEFGVPSAVTANTATLQNAAGHFFGLNALAGATMLVKGSDQGYYQPNTVSSNTVGPPVVVTFHKNFPITPTGTFKNITLATSAGSTSDPPQVEVIMVDGELVSASGTITFPPLIASTTNLTAGTIATVSGSVGSVAGAVGSVSGGVVGSVGSVVGLTSADVAAIKAITDLLNTAQTDPTGVPPANPTPIAKVAWVYEALKNGLELTATKKKFLDSSGAVQWEKDITENGTTYAETVGNAP